MVTCWKIKTREVLDEHSKVSCNLFCHNEITLFNWKDFPVPDVLTQYFYYLGTYREIYKFDKSINKNNTVCN